MGLGLVVGVCPRLEALTAEVRDRLLGARVSVTEMEETGPTRDSREGTATSLGTPCR